MLVNVSMFATFRITGTLVLGVAGSTVSRRGPSTVRFISVMNVIPTTLLRLGYFFIRQLTQLRERNQ